MLQPVVTEKSVEEKYVLKDFPMAIDGKKLVLSQVADWDPFIRRLEKEGAAYAGEFPFWIKIWEGSVVLADYLIGKALPKETRVLELGAGMGVTGLFLGRFGYPVMVTDYEPDSLELLEKNRIKNNLDTVRVRRLDWLDPDLNESFDLICGAELIYREEFIQPLLKIFQQNLAPGGHICLAHQPEVMRQKQFMEDASRSFHIQTSSRVLNGNGNRYKVVIHILDPK